jgi:site-specific DNA-methyltransferase (adenine-specific)
MNAKQVYKIGDSREVLKTISGVNLVITSPPYNVGKEYEDILSLSEYEQMLTEVYTSCYNSMSENSRICVNIPYNMTHPNGDVYNPYICNYTALIKSGFKYRETITWNQNNSDNDTAWGSWCSPSAPWLRHQTEVILVMYKGDWKLNRKGETDLTKEEFLKYVVDVWSMPTARRNKNGHPTPFPVELPIRCIKLFSFIGDLVLDPFAGRGTVLRACRETNRNGIGIEIKPEYEAELRDFALIHTPSLETWSFKKEML